VSTVPVTGYLVQNDPAFATVTTLATVTTTNYADTPPSGATTYYYRVATLNATGRSAFSAGLEATSALLAPASVTAVSGASAPPSVTVTWTPVAGATGYEVVRSDGTVFNASALTWTASATGSATSATDPTPLANTAYTYAVRATATVSGFPMMSAYTAAPSVVTIPSAPALQPVAQGGAQDALVVSWTAPSGQLSPVTGYVLERSLTGTGGWTSVPTTGTATSVTDTGLAFLTTYHYRVATVTAVGQSDWSAIQSGTTGLSAPAAASATASTTGAEVTVTWTAVPTVTAYEVARSDGASFVPPGTSLTTTAAGLSFVDPTVAFGSTYTYAVRALVGPTSSGWATTNPVTTIPTAPSGLVVTATATSVNATGQPGVDGRSGCDRICRPALDRRRLHRAGGRHGHRHGDGERPGAGLRHDVLLPSGRGQPDRPVGVVGVLLGDDAVGSAFGVHRDRHSFTAGQRDAELERQPVDRLLRGAP
jgi:hypothetical protein